MTKKIIFSSPDWHLNGVNIFTANLANELINRGYDVEILLTQTDKKRIYKDDLMEVDQNLPIKNLPFKKNNNYFWLKKNNWYMHWEAISEYLEDNSPCIYIPNYDFVHASVSPTLSDDIIVIGIVHSDDVFHYEQTRRLGRFWNAIVTVSKNLYENVKQIDQYNVDKLFNIDYGVPIPNNKPFSSSNPDSPIKIVYSGRLNQHQKRVFDMVAIMENLHEKNIQFEFNIIGQGSEGKEFLKMCSKFIDKGLCKFHGILSQEELFKVLEENEIFILTSNFEGKPLALIEAMGRGCIPVVTDIDSGIPELIDHGENGFKVPVGDIDQFIKHIEYLDKNRNKIEEFSFRAYGKVNIKEYKVENMADRYIEVFDFAIQRKKSKSFIRPKGDIYPPPFMIITPDIYDTLSWKITTPLRIFGDFVIGNIYKILSHDTDKKAT